MVGPRSHGDLGRIVWVAHNRRGVDVQHLLPKVEFLLSHFRSQFGGKKERMVTCQWLRGSLLQDRR